MKLSLRVLLLALGVGLLASHAQAQSAPMQPPGVIAPTFPQIVNKTDWCGLSQATALKTGKPTSCTMSSSQGLIDINFDASGYPVSATGFDAGGVGHHYEMRHSILPRTETLVDHTQYFSGPTLLGYVLYFQSPAKGPNAPALGGPTAAHEPFYDGSLDIGDRTIQGRTFRIVQAARSMHDLAEREISVTTSVYDGFGSHVDECHMWYRSAESTVGTPDVLLAHFTADASPSTPKLADEHARWTGAGTVPVHCGTSVPRSTAPFFFQDVGPHFGFDAASNRARLRAQYAAWGVDLDANPLSILSAAHRKRLSYGLHPQSGIDDWFSPHAQGNIGNALLAGAGVGFMGLWGGPGCAVVGFFVGFDVALYGSVIQDTSNGIDPRTGQPVPHAENTVSPEDISKVVENDGYPGVTNSDGTSDPSGGANDGNNGGGDDPNDPGGGSCDTSDPNCANNFGRRLPPPPPKNGKKAESVDNGSQ